MGFLLLRYTSISPWNIHIYLCVKCVIKTNTECCSSGTIHTFWSCNNCCLIGEVYNSCKVTDEFMDLYTTIRLWQVVMWCWYLGKCIFLIGYQMLTMLYTPHILKNSLQPNSLTLTVKPLLHRNNTSKNRTPTGPCKSVCAS